MTTANLSSPPTVTASKTKTKLSKKQIDSFFTRLEATRLHGDTESKVEVAVNDLLEAYFKKAYPKSTVTATKAHQTDGLITVGSTLLESFSVLVEAKRGFDLGEKREDRAKILAQAIGYLKKFEAAKLDLPTAVVLADEDENFTLSLLPDTMEV